MGVQFREREIDERTYRVTQFGATRALKLWTRVSRVFLPAFAKGLGAFQGLPEGKSILDAEVDFDGNMLSEAVRMLVEQMHADDFAGLAKDLLASTTCDGREIEFDLHFAGQIPLLLKVLWFVLEVNYGGFFDVLRPLAERARSAGEGKGREDLGGQLLEPPTA